MVPIQIAGLALAGRVLITKYLDTADKRSAFGKSLTAYRPRPRPLTNKAAAINPFETLAKNLSNSFSQLSKVFTGDDYAAEAKKFLPEGVSLLRPRYPYGSEAIRLADVDGDTRGELIASYKEGPEIKTVVMKKKGDGWYKLAEISSKGYDTINYRDIADVTGEGKKHLLLGLAAGGSDPVLHAYPVDVSGSDSLFTKSYQRLEVQKHPEKSNEPAKPQFAVWNKNNKGTYDIELLGWNGFELAPRVISPDYYMRKVAPYYAGLIKRSPDSPVHWYGMAEALEKAGVYGDAIAAADIGLSRTSDSALIESFNNLKDRINID